MQEHLKLDLSSFRIMGEEMINAVFVIFCWWCVRPVMKFHVHIVNHPEDESGKKQTNITKKIRLRKVSYQDELNRYYEFLTNNFEITAEEVAFLYKKRWGIEILFYVKLYISFSGYLNPPWTFALYIIGQRKGSRDKS